MSIAYRRSRFTPTPEGGVAMFGVNKYEQSGSLSSFAASGVNSGYLPLPGVVPLVIATSLDLIAWSQALELTISSLGTFSGTVSFIALVRDATKQPSVTLSQFTTAIGIPFLASLLPLAVGSIYNATTPVTVTSYVPNNTDSYGNVIAAGDILVLDIGLKANQVVGSKGLTGTWKFKLWITAMV